MRPSKRDQELERQILELKHRLTGITQLTGDVTAGSGSGSQAATLSNTGVSAGTYGDATNVGQFTVDAKGRITSAVEVPITGTSTEDIQDAIGTILVDTATVDLDYDDATPKITATVIDDSITDSKLRESGACSVIGRSANSTGNPADISASTNNRALVRRSNALIWDQINLSTDVTGTLPGGSLPTRTTTIGITIDAGDDVITTGAKRAIQIPFACTITAWAIFSVDAAVTSGSIVFDVWKDVEANYPPTITDTITASAKPTLTSSTKASSSTLTGWTTSISAGDVLRFNVDSVTSLMAVTLELTVTL